MHIKTKSVPWIGGLLFAIPLLMGFGPDGGLHEAIEHGDYARVRTLLRGGASADSVDANGNPALLKAAVFGDARMMKLLIDSGANVNATNPLGATALIWAASDADKAKLLLDAGADPRITSKTGRTALHTAAATAGGAGTVKLLLENGASVDARDNLEPIPVVPTGGGKGTPLIEAGRMGDIESIDRLLKAKADVNAKAGQGVTALSEAVLYGRKDAVARLLAAGADPNVTVSRIEVPLLSLAAIKGNLDIAAMLIKAGVSVDQADAAGSTPLMWAARSDRDFVAFVKMLLKEGANPKVKNKEGDSALDWAIQRGATETIKVLRAASAPEKPRQNIEARIHDPKPAPEAIAQAIEILRVGADGSFKRTGCVTCHNHTIPLVAFGMAEARGLMTNPSVSRDVVKQSVASLKPVVAAFFEGTDVAPDTPVTGTYVLEGLKAQNYPADMLTAAVVHNIAMKQTGAGNWVGWAPRNPIEDASDIQSTAMAIRAMRLYPLPGRQQEFERRIWLGGHYLRRATPKTTEEFVMRLLGLRWAAVDPAAERKAVRALASLQRADGGWGQLPGLPSDAYATARAIYALREAGVAQDYASAIDKGMTYLLETQEADGSWHVRTRAFPFQPLLDTGFPHGRDQWISSAATGWATIALLDRPEFQNRQSVAPPQPSAGSAPVAGRLAPPASRASR